LCLANCLGINADIRFQESDTDAASRIDSSWDGVCENFVDMGLREELLLGIYAYGFEKPSAIQQRAIMACVKGFDVIAQAQSGAGKTAAALIAVIQNIDVSIWLCQALIIAPTWVSAHCIYRNI
jgi:translation initiation factor 4A